jgi:hypothetical protein
LCNAHLVLLFQFVQIVSLTLLGLGSSHDEPPTSASPVAGITAVYHHTGPMMPLFLALPTQSGPPTAEELLDLRSRSQGEWPIWFCELFLVLRSHIYPT